MAAFIGKGKSDVSVTLRELATVDRISITDLLTLEATELDALSSNYEFRGRLDANCRNLTQRAFGEGDRAALDDIHRSLAAIYEQDLGAVPIDRIDCETQPILRDVAARFERAVLDDEMTRVPEDVVAAYPQTGREYVRWLKKLVGDHEAASHPLYDTYLKDQATADEFKFFMAQETNLDPRFDDILALMQVGRQGGEKMEIASNYWDEMGNGNSKEVHTELFDQSLRALDIDERYVSSSFLMEAVISGNLSACLALSRRHYYKSVGFFGVTEYLVPRRFRSFIAGWRRSGLPADGIAYHDLHVKIDAVHAAGWFKNVVAPLVDADPRTGRDIAVGALIRLNSSQRYLDAVLARFGGTLVAAHERV